MRAATKREKKFYEKANEVKDAIKLFTDIKFCG